MSTRNSSDYLKHRSRLLNATTKTDDSPPALHAEAFLRIAKLKQDADTYMQSAKNNIELLVNVNGTMRTRGTLDTFPTEGHKPRSNIPMTILMLRKIEEENYNFGQRLLQVKAVMETRSPVPEDHLQKLTEEPFDLPTEILKKYGSQINLTKANVSLRKLFRPVIYFDLEITGVKPLGRIIVELYTEAAPQVVIEFTRICAENAKDRFHFIRLFPSLWFEGELYLNADSSASKKLEYDMRALDHGISGGIMSFAQSNLRGFRYNRLNFAISFKPLSVLNGKRIAFGRVKRGLKMLNSIQDNGSKNGKPKKEIRTTKCGLVR